MTTMEAPPLERKLIAILAADVEGYSRLMHRDEGSALATLSSHRSIIDAIIVQGRGEISGTAGDSVLAEFASVVDAVHSAVSIQQALTKANSTLAPDRQMMLRIGINVGDVMVKDGGIFGDGVNVAARLEAMAEPGSISVTRGVRDHLRDRMDYEFEDLGEHTVKNIARPVRVFRVKFDPNAISPLPISEPVDARSSIQLTDMDALSEGRGADQSSLNFGNRWNRAVITKSIGRIWNNTRMATSLLLRKHVWKSRLQSNQIWRLIGRLSSNSGIRSKMATSLPLLRPIWKSTPRENLRRSQKSGWPNLSGSQNKRNNK